MKIDLQALLAQQRELDRQISEHEAAERRHAIERILELMKDNSLTVVDLTLAKIGRVPQLLEPKYRNPATGATWSGFGKRPRWLRDAMDAGSRLEDYTVWH